MIAYSLLSVVPEVFEDVPVCLEVQIAGPVDSGKARGCEGYQGFCFNPSDDAPEARRGVCVIFIIYVKQWGAFFPNSGTFRGLCPCRFWGGDRPEGMPAQIRVLLVSGGF